MATTYQGSLADRLNRMERENRRCDANGRNCPRTAVDEYEVIPADGHGVATHDAAPIHKKSCSRHRQQFARSGFWVVVTKVDLPTRASQRKPKG